MIVSVNDPISSGPQGLSFPGRLEAANAWDSGPMIDNGFDSRQPLPREADADARGSGARYLLIADDSSLVDSLLSPFEQAGARLETVSDGRLGLGRAIDESFDLVLLEFESRGLGAIELLRQLRRRSPVPVIVLSSTAGRSDRIAALDAGADDFVTDPHAADELLARIRAILRRNGQGSPSLSEIVQVNGVRIAVTARQVWIDEEPLQLTTIEFEVLEILVRSAGRVVSRGELTALIHQRPAAPLERSLDVHVSHLRRKLGPRGPLIRTIRGVGYMFQPEVGGMSG